MGNKFGMALALHGGDDHGRSKPIFRHGVCVHHSMRPTFFGDVQVQRLGKLMDVAQLTTRVHASNLANQNTPGYKARAVAFEDAFRIALDQGKDVDDIEPEVYTPETTPAQADGNDVSADRETLQLSQNQTLYSAYVAMIQQKKKLYNLALTNTPGG